MKMTGKILITFFVILMCAPIKPTGGSGGGGTTTGSYVISSQSGSLV